jgi:hypothetical protein
MPELNSILATVNGLYDQAIKPTFMPALYDLSFRRKRTELCNRIPRNSKGVNALKVKATFKTESAWSWGALSEQGRTPTGTKATFAGNEVELSCHAASATASLHAIEACKSPESFIDLMESSLTEIKDTFPLYLRALIWSSQNAKKAIGKVASVSGSVVTLSGTGMWFTIASDMAKLFERGMYVQVYRATEKVGAPVKVVSVDRILGKVTLSSDPGVQANDVITLSDVAGLDQRYTDKFPGLFDVIDDDNTFQGVDRSTAASEPFRAIVTSASGKTFNRATVSAFLRQVYDPAYAFVARETYDKYCDNIATTVERSVAMGQAYEDNIPFLQIGNTKLMVDDDVPQGEIIVPDFDNLRIADRGGIEDLFGMGWQKVPGTTIIEKNLVWWGLLMASDTRYMGRLHSISLE